MVDIPLKKYIGSTWEKLFPSMDDFNGLAGEGRTTETVKGNADALGLHLANNTAHGINNKANKSTLTTATLLATGWSGSSAPYTYTLSVTGVTATSVQEILPDLDITGAQLLALQSANIQDGGQAENSITIKAFGTKPAIDIPIRIILRGDM